MELSVFAQLGNAHSDAQELPQRPTEHGPIQEQSSPQFIFKRDTNELQGIVGFLTTQDWPMMRKRRGVES